MKSFSIRKVCILAVLGMVMQLPAYMSAEGLIIGSEKETNGTHGVSNDTVKPLPPESPPALYPKFVLYISPGIGGNMGKKIGQVQKNDVTDLTNSTYVLHGVSYERPSFDYDVGIQLNVLSTKRIFMRVGVGIENIVYNGSAKGVVYHFKNGSFTDSLQENWDYTYQDEFLQVPVSFSYRLSEAGKNYLGINLGVTGSLLVQETCSGNRPDAFDFHGKFGSFGTGSVIYVFQSHRPGEGSLSVEPELKYMLNPLSDRRVFWTCGIKLGLAFGFNKNP
jgi:hypothetical protein